MKERDVSVNQSQMKACSPPPTPHPPPLPRSLHLSAKTAVIETSSAGRLATLTTAVLAALLVAGAS